MYVGRIVAVGRTAGRSFAGYRVSSRSFPNRKSTVKGRSVTIAPKDPLDLTKNPYITYTCIRVVGDTAVVANGTQADTIAEKIGDGMVPLDAIGLTLLTYGYERDELSTPRIAGAVRGSEGWLGIACRDEIRAKQFHLDDGDAFMVATYEKTGFEAVALAGDDAASVARAAFTLPFEKPVCSAAACQGEIGFELAAYTPV